jgi:hypothetical protein
VCRSLRAMEIAARLAQPCPPCIDVDAPASLQAKGVEALRAGTRQSRVPPGDWAFEPRAFT